MAVAFMALFSLVVRDRVSERLGGEFCGRSYSPALLRWGIGTGLNSKGAET